MNKLLTSLFIIVGSIAGVAEAACGPNGCSADTVQYSAPKSQRPNYGYNQYAAPKYQGGKTRGCSNCSR